MEEDLKDKSVREWTAIRGECKSGGEINELCNLVAASQGKAEVEIIRQILSCGCILVRADADDENIFI